jgi:hypothetical protein
MSAQEKAEQIYIYLDLDFVASECSICLLHQHCENKTYWEEVWEQLLDKYGERWQQIEFQYQRKEYIKACQL